MNRIRLLLALGICFFGPAVRGQVSSTLVGSPGACRNGLDVRFSYTVQNRFTNTLQVPMVVEIGTHSNLDFYLFKDQTTTNPDDAVLRWVADNVIPSPTKKRTLKPGESMEWTSIATVFAGDENSSGPFPKEGDYFLWPLQDIRVSIPQGEVPKNIASGNWIPVRVPHFERIRYGHTDELQQCKKDLPHRAIH